MIKKEHEELLTKMLSKVGDLNFKRRVLTMLDYLDIQPGEVILDMGCGEGFYSVIFDKLYDCKVYAVDYDETQSIGKRYRRQDAIGTPFCVTIDHQTKEDGTVTIRHRDSMLQERVKMEEVKEMVMKQL